jgi:hypothetical protein
LVGLAGYIYKIFTQLSMVTIFAGYAIAGTGLHSIERNRQERAQWDEGVRWLAANHETSPMVIDGAGTFLKLVRYSPPEIHSRISILPDPARARQYGVDDSADNTLVLLNPWFHLPLDGYDAFTGSHVEFLVLSDHWRDWAEWQWLTRALVKDGFRVSVKDQHGRWLLYRVTRSRDE